MDIETYKSNIATLQKEKSKCVQRRSAGLYRAYPVCPEQPEKERVRAEKHASRRSSDLKKSIQEAEVTSEIDGVVKSINNSSDDSAGYSGSSSMIPMRI